MKIAFYAPMKPPTHPVPSGDRTIARNLILALQGIGAEAILASEFSCRDGRGDARVQQKLIDVAGAVIPQLVQKGRQEGWQAWVSYHNYYKAPDLLGPAVSQALGIPYLQVESTRARKRFGGPWDRFAHQAEEASDRADMIFYFTQRDAEALRAYAPVGQKLRHLKPFLGRHKVQWRGHSGFEIVSVGMMRERDKLPSYRVIAEALSGLHSQNWSLSIAGDGPARAEVEQLIAPFGEKVRLLGALDEEALAALYRRAGIFFWPGVNEAIGMTYLEAQAESLAILAQDRPGMRDILPPGPHPTEEEGPPALARRLDQLLSDPEILQEARLAAFENVRANFLLPQASATLAAGLAELRVTP